MVKPSRPRGEATLEVDGKARGHRWVVRRVNALRAAENLPPLTEPPAPGEHGKSAESDKRSAAR